MRIHLWLAGLLIVLVAGFPSAGQALDRQAFQELQFQVQHHDDPAVRQAFQVLLNRGVLNPVAPARQEADRGPSMADCQLLVGEGLLQSALVKEALNKKLPKQVLELKMRFSDRAFLINGRLDGPLFLNPRFEATIDFAFLTANAYRIRIHSLKVAGFELGLFTRILKGYVEDAMKRVFINGCSIRTTEGADGSVQIDVSINPDGLVPGLGKKAFLSNMEMSARMLRFSFTLTR